MCVLIILDDSDNLIFTNCTDVENSVDVIVPTLLLTIRCGLSFLCLMSSMIYTLNKTLLPKI